MSHVLTKEREPKKEKKKSEVAGWSSAKMEERTSKHEFKDTEEMVQWRNINQGGINMVWIIVGTISKEVLDKYKVEDKAREEHTTEEVSHRSGEWSRESKHLPRK